LTESTTRLVPPWLSVGTEVGFGPCGEDNLSISVNITVGKSERKWGWSTYYSSGRSILRSMAWAHEFIVRCGPWYNTSQVSAHSVKSVALKSLVFLYNKVSVKRRMRVRRGCGKGVCQRSLSLTTAEKVLNLFKL